MSSDDPRLAAIYQMRRALTSLEFEVMEAEPGDDRISIMAADAMDEFGEQFFNEGKADALSSSLPLS